MTKCDFYHWRDMRSMRKRLHGEKAGPLECYGNLIRWFEQRHDGMSVMTCNAELEWYKFGNPYYKIYPAMLGQLMRVNIDIAGCYLHMPFPTIEVRLPKTDPLRERDDTPAVCALLIHSDGGLANDWPTRSGKPMRKRDWSFVVHYQLDADLDKDWMGWYFMLGIDNGKLISDQFEETWPLSEKYRDDYVPGKEFVQGLVKMAVAICFFGLHAHEMVCPDIPQRFIERWHKAKRDGDKSEAEKLLDKAKRLGMFGWKVGSEIDLPAPIVRHFASEDQGGKRGELQAGHVRSGHLRLQPYGPKDKPEERRHELIFIPPTIVRPDLPLRDIRGFRIRKQAPAAQPGGSNG